MKLSNPLSTAILLAASLASSLAVAETRQLDEFTQLKYAVPFEVELVADDEYFVVLEGDQDTIDEIETEVTDDKLIVSKDSGWFDWNDGDVHLTIHYVDLEDIAIAGSGDAYAKSLNTEALKVRIAGSAGFEIDELECNDLTISIAGSGNVNFNDIDADSIITKIAGSGDIELAGRAVSQEISISGSGGHSARDLRTQETEVKIAGSGDVEVWAVATLDATIVGSGDVDYFGNPSVDKTVRGSGDIQHRGDEP